MQKPTLDASKPCFRHRVTWESYALPISNLEAWNFFMGIPLKKKN